MELTEEQYEQVIRYVGGEMAAEEQTAFEAALIQNGELAEEVESYREVCSVGASIVQKIDAAGQCRKEEDGERGDVSRMLQQIRKDWEQRQEGNGKEGDLQAASVTEPEKVTGWPDRMAPAGEAKEDIPWQGGNKVSSMNARRWLVAAVTAGFVCAGALWWYAQNKKSDAGISARQKPSGLQQVAKGNKPAKADTPAPAILPPDTLSFRNMAQTNKQVEKATRDRLVKSNFQPDGLPSEVFGVLETPSGLYKEQRYGEAIAAYKEVLKDVGSNDPDLAGRGPEEKKLTTFLSHYYIGQSYLSVGRSAEAVTHLKLAVDQSPEIHWKSKARWYLALAYVKEGQPRDAGKLLQQISNTKEAGGYRQRAERLNSELQKQRIYQP